MQFTRKWVISGTVAAATAAAVATAVPAMAQQPGARPSGAGNYPPVLSFLFNPCCLGCPVLLVLPGVSW